MLYHLYVRLRTLQQIKAKRRPESAPAGALSTTSGGRTLAARGARGLAYSLMTKNKYTAKHQMKKTRSKFLVWNGGSLCGKTCRAASLFGEEETLEVEEQTTNSG